MLALLLALLVGPASIDGEVQQWDGPAILVGPEAVRVRLANVGERSLTGGAENVALLLDLDGDPSTGGDLTAEGGVPGIDLRIDFNAIWPTPAPGERGRRGTMVTGFYAGGGPFEIHQYDLALTSAPTHAASDFEVYLQPGNIRRLPTATAEATGTFLIVDRGNNRTVARGPRLAAEVYEPEPIASATLPEVADGAVRVMAWNVLYEGPMANPEPFGRIINAVGPDVILVQEWSRDPIDDALLEGWFAEHVGGTWFVETAAAQGVAVVSRGEITARGPDAPDAGGRHPARIAAATVATDHGPLTLASLHLKCCGHLDSEEDATRQAEAEVAQQIVRNLAGDGPAIIGGDFNLVGGVAPIKLNVNGDLTPALPHVLGTPGLFYTWRDPRQHFGRSRLDYVLLPKGATAEAAFVLDTATLPPEALEAAGLRPTDSLASDHLPIVVDVVLP
jgi:endonuclease/exonuclease/phosphatase family metal-dependent hydrolase